MAPRMTDTKGSRTLNRRRGGHDDVLARHAYMVADQVLRE